MTQPGGINSNDVVFVVVEGKITAGARDELLRLIVDSATDYVILTTDLERRVTSWSSGAEATFGYAAPEIVGRLGDVLFTPEDRAAGAPEQETGTARREGVAPDVRWHQRKDGSRVFLDGSTRLLRDQEGREVGFLKVARDETERWRSQEVAREIADRAAGEAAERTAILGQLAEGVIVTNREGRITFVNDAAERLHGVKLLGVPPDAYAETYHLLTEAGDAYPPRELPLARAALLGETVTDARWRIRRPDGTEILAIGSAKPILGPDGSRVGAVLTVRDDSGRSRAEGALRESEARLRALTDNLPSGMVYQVATGRDGAERRFLYVSQSHERLTGVPAEAVLADPTIPYELIVPEDRPAMAEAEAAAIRENRRFDVEVRFRRIDGELRWSRIISEPREQADGSFVWDGIQIDTTDAKIAEERLRHRSEQMHQLAEAALVVARAPTLEATLDVITEAARRIIGAHQGVVSLTRGPDWSQAINAVSITAKYDRWRDYAEMPDGSGIYAWACEENRPARMTQAELEAHPRWRGFGRHAKDHPPMRGWLAAPLVARDGRNLGLIQLSDKEDGSEFDEADEAMLVQLAQFASAAVEQAQTDTALRASEEFSRRVLQASADCIKVLDLDASLEFMSEGGMCVMEVDDFAAIKGACWPDFWSGEEHPKAVAAVEEAKHGGVGRFQGTAPTMKGTHRWWDVIVSPINGPDGKPEKLLSVSRDVTASKQAEAQLGETSRRLDAILNNTRQAVFLMDDRQQCVFANAAAEKLTGYSFEEMRDQPLHDVIHHKKPDGSHYPLEECPIDRAFPERAQMSGEELFVHRDGSFYPVAFTASPLLDETGKPIGTVIEARNIAKEKAANQRLSQLAAVVEQSRDFIGVADLAGRPVYVNEAGRAMVGLPSPEAARAVDLLDYFAPADRETIQAEALPAAGSGGYWEGEVAFRRFDDEREFPVLYNLFPVREAGDRITHYATVTRDLTEKKNVEAELRHLNANLEARVEARTRELLAAEEQLRQAQKMEAVGQLTGGIAHDFNNLLTGVIGSLDMMQRRIAKGETDRIERYATAAMTSANRAAALTHRLLAFSRRQPLDPKPVNANRLITGMEELLRRTIGESVRLEIVTAGGLWQTLCDPHQLESAILNLAINARDAMPEGGMLTLETCNAHLDNAYAANSREVRPGQYICICVTDTGTGMDKETIAKAFEPFFTTKPIGQGTGLGLSMVYGFARQSEGYAKIYSEMGQGTTIKLYLPRYYGEGEDAEEVSVGLSEEHRAEHGEVVLVVEDETAVRDLVVDVLQELGYRAVEASDGPSGLKLLQSDMRIDLLVTDVGLPGLNGRQLADAAREHRTCLKVLFMTGYAENATLANGFLEPGMQMITKPFAIEALATRIRDMIEAGS